MYKVTCYFYNRNLEPVATVELDLCNLLQKINREAQLYLILLNYNWFSVDVFICKSFEIVHFLAIIKFCWHKTPKVFLLTQSRGTL